MKKIKILVDNGHNKSTLGKQSPDGRLKEWYETRLIAKMLVEKLTYEGIDAIQLFPKEEEGNLVERTKIINKIVDENKKNGIQCLLISIHINAAGNGGWHNAKGISVWVSNNASNASKEFAQLFFNQVENNGLKGNRCVPKEKYWTSNFYILKNTKCPAVLTENLFQDNKEDVEYLLSEEGKEKIVECHYKAIMEYIN